MTQTPLTALLTRQIATTGPLTLADYMAQCLLHPEHGYYTTRDPLGTQGDFTTAPEISQMFGELLGLALAQNWLDQGAPSPFVLAELGPGRGTLMADLLRATRAVPGFHAALKLHLVEASPTLRAAQAERLNAFDPTWHDSCETLPQAPLFLVANEFFDALPIRQFRRDGMGWREVMVGLQSQTAKDPAAKPDTAVALKKTEAQTEPSVQTDPLAQTETLCFGLSDGAPQAALAHRLEDTKDGDLVELCAPAQSIIGEIGNRLCAHGGLALVIDYGDWRSLGDTLQALQAHKPVDPLAQPGAADLTAHVDFEALADASTAAHSRLTPQGVFLERLGITQRAQALARGLSGAALEQHIAAHRRLTHPQEMGSLFKILALFREGAPLPPGLEP